MTRPLVGLALLALVSFARPAAADLGCVGDIRDAGPDGSFCHGGSSAAPQQAPVVSPQVQQFAAGAAGAIGAGLGAALVPSLPPMPQRTKIKPISDDDDVDNPDDDKAARSSQDIINSYDGPLTGDDGVVPRSPDLPAPASKAQVDATIAELNPWLTYDRTAKDALDPWFKKNCDSGCGCVARRRRQLRHYCTDACSGVCYGQDLSQQKLDGVIDCSHLIRQENLSFWLQADVFGRTKKCVLGPPNTCGYGTQQQLSLLKSQGLDDINQPQDLRAGDVAYFNEDGSVQHVAQVASTPSCSNQGGQSYCQVDVIQAPHSGVPVQRNTFTLINGQVVEVDGRVVDSPMKFYAGGTPPAGPKTGGSR